MVLHLWCSKCVFEAFRVPGLRCWSSLMHMRGREFRRFSAVAHDSLPKQPRNRFCTARWPKIGPPDNKNWFPSNAGSRRRIKPRLGNDARPLRITWLPLRSDRDAHQVAPLGNLWACGGKGMAGSQPLIILVQLRAQTRVLACVGSGFVVSDKRFEAFRWVRLGWLELANAYEG